MARKFDMASSHNRPTQIDVRPTNIAIDEISGEVDFGSEPRFASQVGATAAGSAGGGGVKISSADRVVYRFAFVP
ncbi:MAG: hypothetical protein KIT25_10605 [Enhydrobacter sp.]|nr:MAG: hypothetical protein KIT25_10605 [Enhydrobacter sp.]